MAARVNRGWRSLMQASYLILSASIALGSGIGGVLRFWCSGAIARAFGETFPWGTLFVNIVGSFLIGLLACFFTQHFPSPLASAFLVTGFLGGLSTFSSMMNEIMQLFLAGQLLEGCAYLLSQLLIGLLAVFAGYFLMSRIPL